MKHRLARLTGEPDLELSRAHSLLAEPRRGSVDFGAFEHDLYTDDVLRAAGESWRVRAAQEYYSLALFTELSGYVQELGAPLDWSGAFARMIADEVRHTDLSMQFAELLGAPPLEIDPAKLRLAPPKGSLRAHVRELIVAAFCIGETLSGRMFRESLRAATVPLAREVVSAIVVDETFHAAFGWEAAALLMRMDRDFPRERDELAARLPHLFRHYAVLSGAEPGRAWAMREPSAPPDPNFGLLTDAGYARAYFEGMSRDVVPALVAIGLPEAESAWARVSQSLP